MFKVILDAGHGGRDKGASGNGVVEASYVLELALRAEQALERALQPLIDLEVNLTRIDDTATSLSQRAALAAEWDADLVISLHVNAFEHTWMRGVHTFYRPDEPVGFVAAKALLDAAPHALKGRASGVHNCNSGSWGRVNACLKSYPCPAILLETGFCSNETDAAILRKRTTVPTYCVAIASAAAQAADMLEENVC